MDLFLIQIRVSLGLIEENITHSYLNLGAKILNPWKNLLKSFFWGSDWRIEFQKLWKNVPEIWCLKVPQDEEYYIAPQNSIYFL